MSCSATLCTFSITIASPVERSTPPEFCAPVAVPISTCPPVKFCSRIAFTGPVAPSTVTRWKSTRPMVMSESCRPVPSSVLMVLVVPVTLSVPPPVATRPRASARTSDVSPDERHVCVRPPTSLFVA